MSRRQRIILIAAGVVIVLLFVAAVACQGRTRDGGLIDRLGDRLGASAAADPADLSIDCQEPDGRLVFDGSCTIEVAAADERLRLVTLRAQEPIEVSAPAPAGDSTVDSEVAAGDVVRVAVGSDGAEIDLSCEASDECVVLLGAGNG